MKNAVHAINRLWWVILPLLGSFLGLSCGEEESPTETAQTQCESLYQAYCERSQTCELIHDADGCFMLTQEETPCAGEENPDDDANACLEALAEFSCERLPTEIPSICNKTVLGADNPVESAVEECRVLVETYCEMLSFCGIYLTEEKCRDEAYEKLPCDDAASVSTGYETCLSDLDALTCENVEPMPASCSGVIVFTDEDLL